MMSIFSDIIEEIMEVFMDDFSVYGKTLDSCLQRSLSVDSTGLQCMKTRSNISEDVGHVKVTET